jgi:hypothetical protein
LCLPIQRFRPRAGLAAARVYRAAAAAARALALALAQLLLRPLAARRQPIVITSCQVLQHADAPALLLAAQRLRRRLASLRRAGGRL